MNFWHSLRNSQSPILGLAPMDGVTDAPTRKLFCEIGKPDVCITEFVNVEGLARGAIKMLDDFIYDDSERPVVAQIYGVELDGFYTCTLIACELGFDGVDINMGCPAKKVERRGAGAGLIQDPEHAKKIITTVQQARTDYANGITMHEAQIRPKVIQAVERMKEKYPHMKRDRFLLPVSVKTRMGYDEIIIEHWLEHLLETELDALTLHGRVLKQKLSGEANWDIIAKAADIIKKESPDTIFLGNGDISSRADALERIAKAGTDGALIGRATFGNPWIFSEKQPEEQPEEVRKKTAIRHCELFEEILPHRQFFIMRKHLGWYMKDFSGCREMRGKLMLANNTKEVREIMEG